MSGGMRSPPDVVKSPAADPERPPQQQANPGTALEGKEAHITLDKASFISVQWCLNIWLSVTIEMVNGDQTTGPKRQEGEEAAVAAARRTQTHVNNARVPSESDSSSLLEGNEKLTEIVASTQTTESHDKSDVQPSARIRSAASELSDKHNLATSLSETLLVSESQRMKTGNACHGEINQNVFEKETTRDDATDLPQRKKTQDQRSPTGSKHSQLQRQQALYSEKLWNSRSVDTKLKKCESSDSGYLSRSDSVEHQTPSPGFLHSLCEHSTETEDDVAVINKCMTYTFSKENSRRLAELRETLCSVGDCEHYSMASETSFAGHQCRNLHVSKHNQSDNITHFFHLQKYILSTGAQEASKNIPELEKKKEKLYKRREKRNLKRIKVKVSPKRHEDHHAQRHCLLKSHKSSKQCWALRTSRKHSHINTSDIWEHCGKCHCFPTTSLGNDKNLQQPHYSTTDKAAFHLEVDEMKQGTPGLNKCSSDSLFLQQISTIREVPTYSCPLSNNISAEKPSSLDSCSLGVFPKEQCPDVDSESNGSSTESYHLEFKDTKSHLCNFVASQITRPIFVHSKRGFNNLESKDKNVIILEPPIPIAERTEQFMERDLYPFLKEQHAPTRQRLYPVSLTSRLCTERSVSTKPSPGTLPKQKQSLEAMNKPTHLEYDDVSSSDDEEKLVIEI
ncbi:uncharacterized protein LOC120309842 [Crotalus tigris]|uniref:uncharacterized protein LOC120309842 n=1 Tax=Crotalus tigris TaxID=88082 RepID=UPI00192F6DEB|nr:uncharacterized protein LOC120309842 [Crotalus tigris]